MLLTFTFREYKVANGGGQGPRSMFHVGFSGCPLYIQPYPLLAGWQDHQGTEYSQRKHCYNDACKCPLFVGVIVSLLVSMK